MKEFEKLLFEDTKRKENEKALTEVNLGLFEQKQEPEFDFSLYIKMTYQKKYKGLYDLYQDRETMALVFVCPLVENNKGDVDERKDLTPYAYDVIYLENLTAEEYELVKKAAVHEKSRMIDTLYVSSIVLYFVLLIIVIASILYLGISTKDFNSVIYICGPLISMQALLTVILPMLMMKYRKFKAE